MTTLTQDRGLVLTCTECATQREMQQFEQYSGEIGSQTAAYCKPCGKVVKHIVGLPTRSTEIRPPKRKKRS